MGTQASRLPSITLHKVRRLARVRLNGRDVYLGPWGDDDSKPCAAAKQAYDRVIAEWLDAGRRLRDTSGAITITELILAYDDAHGGVECSEVYRKSVRTPLRRLRLLYGSKAAAEFTPACLKALRRSLVEYRDPRGRRLSRGYINDKAIARVRALFKWGVSEGMVPAPVWQALLAVEPLKFGQTEAVERPPVKPVPDDVVDRTLACLPPVVADMVTTQRLTGARPGEVCNMRWVEIDATGEVWVFAPQRHKTAHHGRVRRIFIGPKAQAVLMKYRARPVEAPIFSPAESEVRRRSLARAARKSKVTPSQRERDERNAAHPQREVGDRYTTMNYGQAIRRAALKAGVPSWAPNQLRHSRGTEVRKRFGLEAAQVLLGHAKADVTQIYAERDEQAAVRIAAEVG